MKYLILLTFFITSLAFSKEIRILEVDTGIDLSHKRIRTHVSKSEWTNPDYIDTNSHGTHIAGIILEKVCPQVKLISCKYFYDHTAPNDKLIRSIDCFKRALNENVDIVNYSSSGNFYDKDEFNIIKLLGEKGIIFVTAAGNEGKDLSNPLTSVYPAKYDLPNIVVVGNLEDESHRHFLSNYGLKGMKWEFGTEILSTLPDNKFGYMTGTSHAAARYTNKLLLKLCKENHD